MSEQMAASLEDGNSVMGATFRIVPHQLTQYVGRKVRLMGKVIGRTEENLVTLDATGDGSMTFHVRTHRPQDYNKDMVLEVVGLVDQDGALIDDHFLTTQANHLDLPTYYKMMELILSDRYRHLFTPQ